MSIITIWFKAFIPETIKDVTFEIQKGELKGKTYVYGPPHIKEGYLTDQRSFDSDINAKARITLIFKIDLSKDPVKIEDPKKYCDSTKEINIKKGEIIQEKVGKITFEPEYISIRQGDVKIKFNIEAGNPLVIGSGWAKIDFNGTISIKKNMLKFSGFIDCFPAFEGYFQVNNNPVKEIFRIEPEEGKTPNYLIGSADRQVEEEVKF